MWQYNDYSELYHHGILGQKWGIRRYQNPDGTLTAEGRIRYNSKSEYKEYLKKKKERTQAYRDNYSSSGKYKSSEAKRKAREQAVKDLIKEYGDTTVYGWNNREQLMKNSIIGAAIGGVPGAVVVGGITALQQKKLAEAAKRPWNV